MKLAFCLFKYFPYGGLQRDFLHIAQTCQQRGHTIDVYTMRWEGPQAPGLAIHIVKTKGWQNHTRCADYANRTQYLLQRKSYDRVIGFNKMPGLDFYYAADACYQTRVKEQRHGFYRLLPRYKVLMALEKAVFEESAKTRILLISPKQQEVYRGCYQTPSDRFHYLPPGIAQDRIATIHAEAIREQVRNMYHLAPDDLMLLAVGSGFKTKGLDRTILGLAALPNDLKKRCHLFVIGQDNPKLFKKLAKKNQVMNQIHFLGGRDDVPHFLVAADLLVHPAYHENAGAILLEAAVAGLPILTVDVCGYAHYVSEAQVGTVLCSPFNQALFNNMLEKMLLSPVRPQWHKNGLVFAKQADIYHLPQRAADIIEQY